MRILYDGAIYQWQSTGGINRYFTNLIHRLPHDFEPTLTTCRTRGIAYPTHPRLRMRGFDRFRPARLSVVLERAYLSRVAPAERYDVVHPTYYTSLSHTEVRRGSRPLVVTVWDMTHERFPSLDPGGLVKRKRRTIESADALLCISEHTRQELLAHYRVDPSKVTVTPLASDLDLGSPRGDQRTPSRPYFLYVGARTGYKNFDGLLVALTAATSLSSEIMLCVVGRPFDSTEEHRIAELGLAGRIENYGHVSDEQLTALYSHSVALVYPSLYEGFGIPPLEAMQCGTPVVAANCASIPEVVSDAGLLFDPARPDELAHMLESLVTGTDLRERLIARGFERARHFSWDRTARQTVDVYRALVGRT